MRFLAVIVVLMSGFFVVMAHDMVPNRDFKTAVLDLHCAAAAHDAGAYREAMARLLRAHCAQWVMNVTDRSSCYNGEPR